MTTGVFFHDEFAGRNWPIVGDRYEGFPNILRELEEEIENIVIINSNPVHEDLLTSIHDKEYIQNIKKRWYYRGAVLSVGATITACEKVCQNEFENAVCFGVASGHHTHLNKSWGGTYISHIGPILTRLRQLGLEKVLYLDTDAHHGDGARAIIKDDDKVLHICFCDFELNEDDRNICIKIDRESSDSEYMEKVKGILPQVEEFDPEIIIHFFGHDNHHDDYGDRGLTSEFFPELAGLINDFSKLICDGKYVMIDGGGMNHDVGKIIWPEIIKILSLH